MCICKSFDSKLVRLKDRCRVWGLCPFQTFRFQTGSIKSREQFLWKSLNLMFRFQTGSIKREMLSNDFFETDASFDSKLVRLKVEPISLNKKGETEAFRFQTGSIKSIRVISFKPIYTICVSIPNWFD